MPLDLSLAASSALPSPDAVAQGVAIEEQLLFELPGRLGVHAPIWQKLAEGVYDDPDLTLRQVELLVAEVRLLRERWLANQGDRAARADATRETLDRLAELCEAALTAGVGLHGVSD